MSTKSKNLTSSRKKGKTDTKPQQSDLATQIIEKEIELDQNCSTQIIHELMALYTKAVEYYEQINDPKCYDFQDRMHKMLIKPQVIASLQKVNCQSSGTVNKDSHFSAFSPSQGKLTLSIEIEETGKLSDVIRKVEKIENGSLVAIGKNGAPMSPTLMDSRKAESELTSKVLSKELSKTLSRCKNSHKLNFIIDRQSSTSKDSASKAVLDFKSQESDLERRIATRKISNVDKKLMRSYNSIDCRKGLACDMSYTSEENSTTKSSFFLDQHVENYEKFEKKLEEIMDKNYSEKAAKIAEVRFKYEYQISEISGTGDIMDMLVKHMKVNMQEEITSIHAEFDAKRKEDIRKLKESSI